MFLIAGNTLLHIESLVKKFLEFIIYLSLLVAVKIKIRSQNLMKHKIPMKHCKN